MAGHLLLLREDEPDTFEVLERLGRHIVEKCEFGEAEIYGQNVKRISDEYVYNKLTDKAYKIGPFVPQSIESDEPITLEVHYLCVGDVVKLKYVFYVA